MKKWLFLVTILLSLVSTSGFAQMTSSAIIESDLVTWSLVSIGLMIASSLFYWKAAFASAAVVAFASADVVAFAAAGADVVAFASAFAAAVAAVAAVVIAVIAVIAAEKSKFFYVWAAIHVTLMIVAILGR